MVDKVEASSSPDGSREVTDAAYERVGSGVGVVGSRVVGGDIGGRVVTTFGWSGVAGLVGGVDTVAKRMLCCMLKDRTQVLALYFAGCAGTGRVWEVCRCRIDGTEYGAVTGLHSVG